MNYPDHNPAEARIKHYFESHGTLQNQGDLFKEFYLASTKHIDKLKKNQIINYRETKKALFEARLAYLKAREKCDSLTAKFHQAISNYIEVREDLGFPKYQDYGLVDPFTDPLSQTKEIEIKSSYRSM